MQANTLKALIVSKLYSTPCAEADFGRSALDVCFGDSSLTLRMTKEVLRMTGELGRTRRSVMLNEVKHLPEEDPSLRSG